jgi:hypothetical protein
MASVETTGAKNITLVSANLTGINTGCLVIYFEYKMFDPDGWLIGSGNTDNIYIEGAVSKAIWLVSGWDYCDFRAIGIDSDGVVYYSEWDSFSASILSDGFYLGFQYWETANPSSVAIVWYNPPFPDSFRSPITVSQEFSMEVVDLKQLTNYSFRAMAYDLTNYYYGETLFFTTLEQIDETIFGVGEGRDYVTSREVARRVTKVAIGRTYVDNVGSLTYESRNVRP